MDQGQASWTAHAAARHRAMHQWLDDEPNILTDPVVESLLDPGSREPLPVLQEKYGNPRDQSLRAVFALRSRFAEDELEIAAARGVQQYVILGAGLDTFAFRQPPFAASLRIFEVDHPATQANKQARLVAAGLAHPPNLHWVPVDFERESLAESLDAAAFDAGLPTFFSWLGVMMYLTASAIDDVFRFVAALPHPSTIVLDYTPPTEDLTGFDREMSQRTAEISAARGEPRRTNLRPRELNDWLRSVGFSQVFLLTPEEANARYFAGRRDGLRAPAYAPLACATV